MSGHNKIVSINQPDEDDCAWFRELVVAGWDSKDIANLFGLTPKALRSRFYEGLAFKAVQLSVLREQQADLVRVLVSGAERGDIAAAIALLQRVDGMHAELRPKTGVHTGPSRAKRERTANEKNGYVSVKKQREEAAKTVPDALKDILPG